MYLFYFVRADYRWNDALHRAIRWNPVVVSSASNPLASSMQEHHPGEWWAGGYIKSVGVNQ